MADKVVLTGKRRGWGPKQKRVADCWVGAEEVPTEGQTLQSRMMMQRQAGVILSEPELWTTVIKQYGEDER